ncbi:MAG: hypothetical protein HWE34_10000 [Methylocystaceae bacterium]|nr:hypothetical protein [Methylocystaceae bacterium]
MQRQLYGFEKKFAKDVAFTPTQARDVCSDILSAHPIAPGSRFHNQFYYEIYPITNIATYLGDDVIKVDYLGKEHPIDGQYYFADGSQSYIEMIVAIEGMQDNFILKHLRRLGFIRPAQRSAEALIKLLHHAIIKKKKKSSRNSFYEDAFLGVVFNEQFFEPMTKSQLDQICKTVLKRANGSKPFSRIFILSLSSSYIFDSLCVEE